MIADYMSLVNDAEFKFLQIFTSAPTAFVQLELIDVPEIASQIIQRLMIR